MTSRAWPCTEARPRELEKEIPGVLALRAPPPRRHPGSQSECREQPGNGQQRRLKIVPGTFGEKAALKPMFGNKVGAAEG